MPKHTLSIVTYSRGVYPLTGLVKPRHWAYFFEIDFNRTDPVGVIFQLRGMPGGFHYPGPESLGVA